MNNSCNRREYAADLDYLSDERRIWSRCRNVRLWEGRSVWCFETTFGCLANHRRQIERCCMHTEQDPTDTHTDTQQDLDSHRQTIQHYTIQEICHSHSRLVEWRGSHWAWVS